MSAEKVALDDAEWEALMSVMTPERRADITALIERIVADRKAREGSA